MMKRVHFLIRSGGKRWRRNEKHLRRPYSKIVIGTILGEKMKSLIIIFLMLFYSAANSSVDAEKHYLQEIGWVNVELANGEINYRGYRLSTIGTGRYSSGLRWVEY